MKLLSIQEDDNISAFESFLHKISANLAAAICKKLQAYAALNALHSSHNLKILNPRIWGYKGTIYKLRVDCGKESARVLFVRTADNDIVLLHGFIKQTRKTPHKDAKIAMHNLERVKANVALTPLSLEWDDGVATPRN